MVIPSSLFDLYLASKCIVELERIYGFKMEGIEVINMYQKRQPKIILLW